MTTVNAVISLSYLLATPALGNILKLPILALIIRIFLELTILTPELTVIPTVL